MRVWKDLFGTGGQDKIHSEEIAFVADTVGNLLTFAVQSGQGRDYNDLDPGLYYFNTGAANAPAEYCFVIVLARGTGRLQIAMSLSSASYGQARIYTRRKSDSSGASWNPWYVHTGTAM